MHIVNCLHPRYVLNTVTGERVRVRCGKCSACLNAKAKFWISKLLLENEHNKYAFMVNLTYDDSHLPSLVLDETGNNLIWKNRALDLCIPFSDLDDLIEDNYYDVHPTPGESIEDFSIRILSLKQKERDYLVSRLNHRLGLPCICSDDISKFNKRLNKYIHDHVTGTFKNFRFFLCHEYGPATYRPHCHAVYFFNSDQLAKDFNQVILSCWQNGDSSTACIYSKGGFSYVAQYVNMSCHLPTIYAHKDLKQRHQFSKCPPLGFVPIPRKELRDVYERRVTKRSIWNPSSRRYDVVPIDSAFKNRFFPKFVGYNRVPCQYRVILYRAVELFSSYDYDEFAEAVYQLGFCAKPGRVFSTPSESIVLDYLRDLQMNSHDPRLVDFKLRKFYNVSMRFCTIRDSLGCSSEWLCERIELFYKKVDYEKLVDFYNFQQSYCEINKASDLVALYPDLEYYLNHLIPGTLPDNDIYAQALLSFGIDIYSFDDLDYTQTADYKGMLSFSEKIYKDTHKRQDINNYRYSQKFHYLDSDLQTIILNYAT